MGPFFLISFSHISFLWTLVLSVYHSKFFEMKKWNNSLWWNKISLISISNKFPPPPPPTLFFLGGIRVLFSWDKELGILFSWDKKRGIKIFSTPKRVLFLINIKWFWFDQVFFTVPIKRLKMRKTFFSKSVLHIKKWGIEN